VLLLLMQVMFAGNLDFFARTCTVIPASSWPADRVSDLAATMLALSSLSKSTRFVAILYTGAIFLHRTHLRPAVVITGRRAWPGCRSAQHGERHGRDVPPAAALRNAGHRVRF
jgi:hypothetical protein